MYEDLFSMDPPPKKKKFTGQHSFWIIDGMMSIGRVWVKSKNQQHAKHP